MYFFLFLYFIYSIICIKEISFRSVYLLLHRVVIFPPVAVIGWFVVWLLQIRVIGGVEVWSEPQLSTNTAFRKEWCIAVTPVDAFTLLQSSYYAIQLYISGQAYHSSNINCPFYTVFPQRECVLYYGNINFFLWYVK